MAPVAANDVAINPVAVLLCKTAVTPQPGENRIKPCTPDRTRQGAAEPKPQLRTKPAFDAG
jgi:hypothetical protein